MNMNLNEADAHMDMAIIKARQRKANVILNVQGWAGDTLEEKINSAIIRGSRSDPTVDQSMFKLRHSPDFQMRPGLELNRAFSATDAEIYRAYKAKALQRFTLVEGERGQKVLRNPYRTWMKNQIRAVQAERVKLRVRLP